MGVTSFVTGIVSVGNLILLTVVMCAADRTFSETPDEFSSFNYVLGGWIFGSGLLSVCGLVFGIGGMRQKNRRHRLALVGLCMNSVIPLFVIFVLLMGTVTMEQSDHKPMSRFVDSGAWRSPPARAMQLLTGLGAAGLAIRFRFKRYQRTVAAKIASVPTVGMQLSGTTRKCARCDKTLPATSRFCRRCGHNVTHAIISAPPIPFSQISVPASR